MAADVDTIGLGVDSRPVVAATKNLDALGRSADNASMKADKLATSYDRQGRLITDASIRTTKAAEDNAIALQKQSSAAKMLGGSFSALTSILPILGFTALASSVISSADSYIKFTAQLKNATTSQDQYNDAIKNVTEIANKSQSSIAAIGTTYARLSNSLQEIGATSKQVSSVVETLALALKANGATAVEASSTMLQLSQAFGKGKLDGDEFRTAMEAAPNVMRELAKSMGVPFGALKDLAGQGAITSEVMLKAFNNPDLLAALNVQADAARTIGGAWQEVKNSIGLAVGKLVEFIGLRNAVNKNADLFVEALSPGGFLGGKTDYQKKLAAQQQIDYLTAERNRGNRFGGGRSQDDINSEITALRRQLDASLGNKIGANVGSNDFQSPNFSVYRSDESYKSEKKFNDKLAADAKNKVDESARKAQDAAKQYESLIKSIKDKISAEKQEIALIAQGVPIEDAATIAKYRALGVSDALIVSILNANSAHDKALKTAKEALEQAKLQKEFDEAQIKSKQDVINTAEKYNDSIQKEIESLTQSNDIARLGAEGYLELELTRLKDSVATNEQIIANAKLNGATNEAIEYAENYNSQLKEQIKLKTELGGAESVKQSLENENKKADEAATVFKKAEEDKIREFEKTTDSINNIFREGFANLINGGKGSWKSFTQSLATTFKTTVADYIYKLFAQPFIVKIVASLLGGKLGAAGEAGGIGSVSSLFSGVKGAFDNVNSSIASTITKIGSAISNFGSSGSSFIKNIASKIGSFTQLSSSTLASAFSYVGLAITAFSVIKSLFGKKKIPRFSSQTLGEYENGNFTSKNGAQLYKTLGANSQLGTLSEQFSKTLGALLKGFGLSDKISTKADLLKKRKASYGMFEASFDGGSINVGTSGKAKNVQQTFEQLIEKVLGSGIADAVASSNLTGGVKKFFTSLTKKEDVADAVSTLVNLNQALGDLPSVFNAIRNAIDTTAYNTSIADLKTRFAAIGTYTNLFYSQQEQFDTFTKQLLTQFSLINTALPATRQGFRALVDGIKVVNQATSDQFNGLVALAPAADQYYKSLEAQANAALGASDAIDGLSDRFRTMADLQRYQGLSRNYGVAFAESRIPSYDVGTNYVPNDGLAMLHKGEAVVPAKYNKSNGGGDMSALKSEISGLKAVMVQMATSARRTAEILQNITPNGNALATEAAT